MELIELYRGMLEYRLLWIAAFCTGFVIAGALWLGRPLKPAGGALRNAGVSIAFYVTNFLAAPASAVINLGVIAAWNWAGLPHLPAEIWAGWHPAALLVLAIVAGDFSVYWAHRWMHGRIGWPIHAIHHSDSDVNGFTTLRVHLLEPVVMRFFWLVCAAWLGLPGDAAAGAGLFLMLHNVYVHFDLDWTHGRLGWLIASPRFHRWHHVDDPAIFGHNLANVMPVWDRMFGTYIDPGPVRGKLGAASSGVPDLDLGALWLWPIREWAAMLRGWRSGRADAARS